MTGPDLPTAPDASLAEALRRIAHGALLLDPQGRITWANEAFAQMSGHPVAAMLGRVPSEFCRGPETDRNSAAAIDRGLAGPEPFAVELLCYTASGRTYWSRVEGVPMPGGGFVCTVADVTARRRAEDLLHEVLDALPSGVAAFDAEDRLVVTNAANASMFGTSRADLGRHLPTLIEGVVERRLLENDGPAPGETLEGFARRYAVQLRQGMPPRARRLPDGRVLHLKEGVTPAGTLICVRTDVTELDAERAARARAEALMRDVVDALPVGVFAFDAEERLILANRAHLGALRGAAAWVPGATLEAVTAAGLAQGGFPEAGTDERTRARFVKRHLAQLRASDGTARFRRLADGRVLQLRETRSASGTLVGVGTDVTELDRAQASLRDRAERCQLTGLANRTALLERLDTVARQGSGALLLFDLDHFKQVNDTLGHDAGDALLVAVAQALRGAIRADDLAARLGGDEFAVVMPGLGDPAGMDARMSRLFALIGRPVPLGGRRLQVTVSAGIARWPTDGASAAMLLKHADLALYESKRGGRARWSLFRPEQAEAVERAASMADAVREALDQARITVALQPKRRIAGGRHAGFEALARWHDGERWVPPLEFVRAAEESGQGVALGRAVLDAALDLACEIRAGGLDPGPIAVNVGAAQLRLPGFADEVCAALGRRGLTTSAIEVEVTETVLLGRGGEVAEASLGELRRAGVSLSLDDFGTGYASLSHLARLPLDRLKVDRSFVSKVGLGTADRGAEIARAVIGLARSLRLETVAEGVETAAQFAALEAWGCDAAQGWLIGRPLLGAEAAIGYLAAAAYAPEAALSMPGS